MTKEELQTWKQSGYAKELFDLLEQKKEMFQNLLLSMQVVPDTVYNFNRIQGVHNFLSSVLKDDDLLEEFNKSSTQIEEIEKDG